LFETVISPIELLGRGHALRFFGSIEKGTFLSRPNRFVIICSLGGRIVKAFLPNPGRLKELLLPGATLYLEEVNDENRDLRFTAVAVEREGERVVLHTHRTNDVARYLVETGSILGLEGYGVIKNEVPVGHSRFDFLLKKGRKALLLEVKSCTLFSKRMAMFPDAVTTRGTRHLRELARLADSGTACAVLFLIHWSRAECFLPDFHTDLEFARTMLDVRDKVSFFPMAVRWKKDLSLKASESRLLKVPFRILESELADQGSYLLILRLASEARLKVGGLGDADFSRGYYVYVGSAMKNLTRRIERHRRLRKNFHWHIDYLRDVSEFLTALPVRSEDDLECEIAAKMEGIADWTVPGFGSSDCSCPSHLFGFENHPLNLAPFHHLLQHFRMERLIDKYRDRSLP
jgi:sugar fermentation stimulation protein A